MKLARPNKEYEVAITEVRNLKKHTVNLYADRPYRACTRAVSELFGVDQIDLDLDNTGNSYLIYYKGELTYSVVVMKVKR